ncbi:MAG: hypothetical protein V1933_02850 [Candidatus Omnitrophota bacterium]
MSLALCGCADLKSIRDFSDISSESAIYTAFAGDYVKSLERQKGYQSCAEEKEKLDKIIERRKAQLSGLLAIHKEVSDYMSALGQLASDEIISYDKSLDEMHKKMEKIKDENGKPIFEKKDMDAFGALSKLLAKAATDAYRQNKLKEIIGLANNDFQELITALKKCVEGGYIESLKNEEEAVKKYYGKILKTAENNPPQDAAIELLRDRFVEKKDAVDAKINAAESYVKILDKIGKGHQLLYDDRNDISSRLLLSNIKGYSKDISNLYKSVKEIRKEDIR